MTAETPTPQPVPQPPPARPKSKSRKGKADAERSRRTAAVRAMLEAGKSLADIRAALAEEFGRSPRGASADVDRALDEIANDNPETRRRRAARARLRYERMLEVALVQLRREPQRRRVVEAPGKDGKPQRRLEITSQNVMAGAPARVALEAARMLDRLDGLNRPEPTDASPAAPTTVEVRLPGLWSEGQKVEGPKVEGQRSEEVEPAAGHPADGSDPAS
jgi:hypothetical protein